VRRRLGREAEEQRRGEREVPRCDDTHAPLAGERVDRVVVVRAEPARADHHADAALERGPDVALHGRGMRVVDEHVGVDCVECLGDRRELVDVGASDAGDELEVVRRADRPGDGSACPARDARDADADHGVDLDPCAASGIGRTPSASRIAHPSVGADDSMHWICNACRKWPPDSWRSHEVSGGG
jgi:hypothetical protein